ncbi:MAG: GrpB family protein [Bacilli bacterium]
MGKDLSMMTLEELWELFPIFLVKPNPNKWNCQYNTILTSLKNHIPEYALKRVSHIGSTAINGIWAKDIVDVLFEINSNYAVNEISEILSNNGFIKMSESQNRISFNIGYTKEGFAKNVFHIHLRCAGDNDELYFRDYLNQHNNIAKEYETLKLVLWKKYEHNRDAYTDAKTSFVNKWTKIARLEYKNRYI